MNSSFKIKFKRFVLVFSLLLVGRSSAQAENVSCDELFNTQKVARSRVARKDRTNPPKDFHLTVWRYNSDLLDESGHSSFSNAEIVTLNFDSSSKSYYLRSTNKMRDNRLEESPESICNRFGNGGIWLRPDVVDSELLSIILTAKLRRREVLKIAL